MKYSLDTCALLDGRVRYYPPDIFPSLWSRLEALIGAGDLRATEEVLEELDKKQDEVLEWARAQPDFFVPLDEPVQLKAQEILAAYPGLVNPDRNRSGADVFVIALASVGSCAVVSVERPTTSLRRPHVPDVCRALGAPCLSMVELIRQEG